MSSGATTVINAIGPSPVQAGWKRMKVTVDSGAAESVIPETEETRYAKVPHPHQIFYSTASGEPIMNVGDQELPMYSASGRPCAMTIQAWYVVKPLASLK